MPAIRLAAVLSAAGIARDVDHDVKSRLGSSDAQKSLLDAVERVASTSVGDGEGFAAPSPQATVFATLGSGAAAGGAG